MLRVAVTTSTRDSGLLGELLPVFEESTNIQVEVVAVGTGAALRLGETGDVDVVLVHSRAAEDAFMDAGHGVRREDVMFNSFEILGPGDDPAGVRELDPVAALKRIAAAQAPFVSRGDESGTHQMEMRLWGEAGGRPEWAKLVETGQGMGRSLTIADQLNAYIVCDRGTYLKFADKIQLVPLVKTTKQMQNPYGIIVVNPQYQPERNTTLANRFVDFVISSEAQTLIRDFKVAGEPLFRPLRLQ